ncbi:MAG: metallophosphoesterase [Phycisphaerales bacterium]|nr:metallophosphoesterase [Phycisphaerales bacterium]
MSDSESTPPPFDDDEPDFGDGDSADIAPSSGAHWRRGRLRVLRNAAILVLVGFALSLAAPWILPLSVAEGPLIQNVGGASAKIVWFLSRDDDCRIDIDAADGDEAPSVEIESHGRRRVARIGDIPLAGVTYHIRAGDRELATGTVRPAPSGDSPLRVLVFGDSGEGTPAQYALGRRMAMSDPDLVVHTGDIVYPDGARGDYRRKFFLPYAPLLAGTSFWPCLGNHDVSDKVGAAYDDVFDVPLNGPDDLPPKHNYWFDFGPVRFVVLDSNVDEETLEKRVAPWLSNVFMTCSPDQWRFVVFHHAPFTTWGTHPNQNSLKIRRALIPAIEAAGVDIVFSGHEHMYLRTLPMRGETPATDGVTYIISGAGGGRLYDSAPEEQWPAWLAKWHNTAHSFTLIDIDGHELRLSQQDAEGHVIDEWSTRRSGR